MTVFLPSQKSKCPDLANFSFLGGYSWPGNSYQNEQKFYHASHIQECLALQIVSHILHMWRLMRQYLWKIQWLVSTYSNYNPVLGSQNSRCQDLPKFQFLRGGFCSSQNSKWQDLPKFQFWREVFCSSQNSKWQDLPKFQFLRVGYFVVVKTQNGKICLNFSFWVGIL